MKKFLLGFLTVAIFAGYIWLRQSQVTEGRQLATVPSDMVQATPAPEATTVPSVVVPPLLKPKTTGVYRDGTYTGSSADAYYGNIQVQAVIQGGKIQDVKFLDYPHDRDTSRLINRQAMPMLRSEAIQAQSANVDIISGATDSSLAFRESLGVALARAKN